MKIFTIVLFSLLSIGSLAFAQTEAPADTVSILVEVWVDNNFRSIIIAAAGHEDSCAVNGTDRFLWLGNQEGFIAFSFPLYNMLERGNIESYLPGLDYRKYPVWCLVLGNSQNISSAYPLEFFLSSPHGGRETGRGVPYFYSCFYLKGEGLRIFYFSNNLSSPLAGSRPQ